MIRIVIDDFKYIANELETEALNIISSLKEA